MANKEVFMARLPRLYIPGCSQHVIRRGNNRQACFFTEADYTVYLDKLKEASENYQVAIHAFVLMTNHVHLLVTPSSQEGVARMMQAVGRYYVRYINTVYQRSGTLWEGRYKSTLVDNDYYFLTVSRYIELNPVRAKMVEHPSEYLWSSYQGNGLGKEIQLLTSHELYMGLGKSKVSRQKNYCHLFDGVIEKHTLEEIRYKTNKSWVLGSEKFKEDVRKMVDRRVESSGWGGDRKSIDYKSRTLTP